MNTVMDLYEHNILINRLRPIMSREKTAETLTYLPPIPKNVSGIPRYERLHYLLTLQELHIPSETEVRMSDTVDLLLRGNYRTLDPTLSDTWAFISEEKTGRRPRPPAMSAAITGLPGTGKSCSAQHVLSSIEQTIEHADFPKSSRPLTQLVYLSCEVPASGRAKDFAARLMHEMDRACGTDRFAETLSREGAKGRDMLEMWRKAARSSFLGLLHLDEIQNLFKIPSLAHRRRKRSGTDEPPQLAIVEDECLRALLSFMNSGIPLLISGTPDGFNALNSRLSTSQRILFGGRHLFLPYRGINDQFYDDLLRTLLDYQFVAKPLTYSVAFAELILELTGGFIRIIIALWFLAHRVAFERHNNGDDDLRAEDFKRAADIFLAPLRPALEAARSNNPEKMRNFSDLMAVDDTFWGACWTPTAN